MKTINTLKMTILIGMVIIFLPDNIYGVEKVEIGPGETIINNPI